MLQNKNKVKIFRYYQPPSKYSKKENQTLNFNKIQEKLQE